MFTDIYFTRSKEVAKNFDINPIVRYNVFFRKEGILCGARIAREILYNRLWRNPTVKMWSLLDGESFKKEEPVMLIQGQYQDLVELETSILSMLTLSGPATNMKRLVDAACGVPIIDMSARHYPIMSEMAYAAYIGGAQGTSTAEGYFSCDMLVNDESFTDRFKLFGSIPHCLNAVAGGSIESAKLYRKTFPDQPLTVLTDYEGKEMDIIKEAVEVFGQDLSAIRLDTHGGRVHQGGSHGACDVIPGYTPPIHANPYFAGKGVTIELYMRARSLLDHMGAQHTKIILSSGFNEEKIKAFLPFIDKERTMIGTGSWVGNMDYHPTMDIVRIKHKDGNWRNALKEGREYTASARLRRII